MKKQRVRGNSGCLLFIVALGWGLSHRSSGSAFTFPVLDTTMTSSLFTALATTFTFRPTEPASDLGAKWGLYFGAGAVATDATAVSNVISGLSTSYIPNADIQVGIGLPKGITLELGFLPTLAYSGTTFGRYSGALKWTATRSWLSKLPISLAVRLEYTQGSLSFSEPVNGGTVDVSYGTNIFGGNIIASKFVGWSAFGFEPYVGAGLLTNLSTLSATGTASLFGASFPAGTASVTGNGTYFCYHAGLVLKLSVMSFAAEYANLFGTTSYAGKFSFRI